MNCSRLPIKETIVIFDCLDFLLLGSSDSVVKIELLTLFKEIVDEGFYWNMSGLFFVGKYSKLLYCSMQISTLCFE